MTGSDETKKEAGGAPSTSSASAATQPNITVPAGQESTIARPTSGALDQEVERLKGQVHLAVYVLLVGFAIMFVTVGLFVAQAFYEDHSSYDSLLNKVDILEAQSASSNR